MNKIVIKMFVILIIIYIYKTLFDYSENYQMVFDVNICVGFHLIQFHQII